MTPKISIDEKIEQQILAAQIRLTAKMAELKLKKKTKPFPVKPIFDDVYYEGLKWLDNLAGIDNL